MRIFKMPFCLKEQGAIQEAIGIEEEIAEVLLTLWKRMKIEKLVKKSTKLTAIKKCYLPIFFFSVPGQRVYWTISGLDLLNTKLMPTLIRLKNKSELLKKINKSSFEQLDNLLNAEITYFKKQENLWEPEIFTTDKDVFKYFQTILTNSDNNRDIIEEDKVDFSSEIFNVTQIQITKIVNEQSLISGKENLYEKEIKKNVSIHRAEWKREMNIIKLILVIKSGILKKELVKPDQEIREKYKKEEFLYEYEYLKKYSPLAQRIILLYRRSRIYNKIISDVKVTKLKAIEELEHIPYTKRNEYIYKRAVEEEIEVELSEKSARYKMLTNKIDITVEEMRNLNQEYNDVYCKTNLNHRRLLEKHWKAFRENEAKRMNHCKIICYLEKKISAMLTKIFQLNNQAKKHNSDTLKNILEEAIPADKLDKFAEHSSSLWLIPFYVLEIHTKKGKTTYVKFPSEKILRPKQKKILKKSSPLRDIEGNDKLETILENYITQKDDKLPFTVIDMTKYKPSFDHLIEQGWLNNKEYKKIISTLLFQSETLED